MSNIKFNLVVVNNEIGVKNLETEEIVFPSCGQDLSAFLSYIQCSMRLSKGSEKVINNLLSEVARGGKPITKMKQEMQKTKVC